MSSFPRHSPDITVDKGEYSYSPSLRVLSPVRKRRRLNITNTMYITAWYDFKMKWPFKIFFSYKCVWARSTKRRAYKSSYIRNVQRPHLMCRRGFGDWYQCLLVFLRIAGIGGNDFVSDAELTVSLHRCRAASPAHAQTNKDNEKKTAWPRRDLNPRKTCWGECC